MSERKRMTRVCFKMSVWVTADLPTEVYEKHLKRYQEDEMSIQDAMHDLGADCMPVSQSYGIQYDARDEESWIDCFSELDEVEVEEVDDDYKPYLMSPGADATGLKVVK